MENNEIVSTLNNLIETCKDGEEGFRTCAEDAGNAQLKSLFADRAQSCATACCELQDLVRAYGGKPETRSSLTGTLHRRWIDIKHKIVGKDDQAVLHECERGEDIAMRVYRDALNLELPSTVRTVVERQSHGLRQNQERVRHLQEQVRGAG